MSKDVLRQYNDIRQEIAEVRNRIKSTKEEIRKIETEGVVKDSVSGGYGGTQHFTIEGIPFGIIQQKRILLKMRQNTLATLELEIEYQKNYVEEYIRSIPDSHIRRIITMRFIENLSWAAIACNMGGGNTPDGVRKAFERYID